LQGDGLKSFGIIIKKTNPAALGLASRIAVWAKENNRKAYVDASISKAVRHSCGARPEKIAGLVDMMVVLGGDGTMLSVARLLKGRKIPILGVNLGGLGFLTAITVKEVFPLLERIIKDDFDAEERMMLSVKVLRRGRVISTHDVLNDAVLKGESARLIRLETRINKEYVTTYRADGLIVSTPTGSTAYSLSAAGPILYPTIHSIIVAPICPFNLTNRPVVIPDWMTVDVRVLEGQRDVSLILDGQVDLRLGPGDLVHMRRSASTVFLVKYKGKGYFDILRERLMWEVKAEKKG
jgi:NAD+ kinase